MELFKTICVAIAAENSKNAIEKINVAIKKGANLVEIRLDYFKEITDSQLNELIDIKEIPKIFTIRKKDEGGHFELSETKRIDFLKKCIEIKPDFIDIELYTSQISELTKLAEKHNVKSIISYHDFTKTPALGDLRKLLSQIEVYNGNISKIITMANNVHDNLKVLSLIKFAKKKIITFAMGEKGKFSRVFSSFFGGYFTFASINELTAPGQISIDEMIKIHNIFGK